MDLSQTVAPKSDQLNADDLIAGPRNITITRVSASGSPDQPVAVYFEGDNGKPYLPCKSMRRVMIAAWGPDASTFTGRSMTLYRDPTVKFGGMAVGGIRISHMSHIDKDVTLALTETKAKRGIFKVAVLRVDQKQSAPPVNPDDAWKSASAAASNGSDAFKLWWSSAEGKTMRDAVKPRIDELKELVAAADAANAPTQDDDEIPL